MATDYAPLPDATCQKDRWEYEIYEVVWNQYDSETDDNEAVEKQWGIDAECAHCLFCLYSDENRDEYYAQEPCKFSQQTRCHDYEVLVIPYQTEDARNYGKGNGCGRKYDECTLGKECVADSLEFTVLDELCYEPADNQLVQKNSYYS